MAKLSLINTYKKYPTYKDSSVEWLGGVPENWMIERLKYVAPLYSKKVPGKNGFGTYVALENVESWSGKHVPSQNIVEPESIVNVFESDDILFGKLRPYLAKVFQPNFDGTATGEFLVLRPSKKISKKYLFYRLLSPEFISTVNDSTYGSQMPRASWSFVGNLSITIPDSTEQEKIAKFLDEQTARIDESISKKQRLVELLKEKRTAVINNAVTKGLDPKVELVDSGIDWIGRIPEGWEVKKLKSGFTYEKGKEAGKFTQEYVSAGANIGEFPVYSGQTENEGVLGRINTYAYDYPNGVLFSTTVGAKAMTVRLLKGKFSLSQNCVLMVPKRDVNPEYFSYMLEIGFMRMRDEIPSHMQPSLRVSDLNKFSVLFPTTEQQEAIANYLNKKEQTFNEVATKLNASIDYLKEFKSSLISHAVTGKIKI